MISFKKYIVNPNQRLFDHIQINKFKNSPQINLDRVNSDSVVSWLSKVLSKHYPHVTNDTADKLVPVASTEIESLAKSNTFLYGIQLDKATLGSLVLKDSTPYPKTQIHQLNISDIMINPAVPIKIAESTIERILLNINSNRRRLLFANFTVSGLPENLTQFAIINNYKILRNRSEITRLLTLLGCRR